MSEQLRLDEWTPKGSTIDLDRDKPRLSRQMQAVWNCVKDGQWWSLERLSYCTSAPQASVSARLRDLRALGYKVERQYIACGVHVYRVTKP